MNNKQIILLYLKNLITKEIIYENTFFEFVNFIKNNFNQKEDLNLILNYCYDILKQNNSDFKIYLSIRLIRDLIFEKIKEYENILLNHNIFEYLFSYLSSIYLNTISNQLNNNKLKLKFLLLLFKELDSKFGINEYGKQTKFKTYFMDLKEKGLNFTKIIEEKIYLKNSIIINNNKNVINNKEKIYDEFWILNEKQYEIAFEINYKQLKYYLINFLKKLKICNSIEKEEIENLIYELSYWLDYYSNETLINKIFKIKKMVLILIKEENLFLNNIRESFYKLKNKNIEYNDFLKLNKVIIEEKKITQLENNIIKKDQFIEEKKIDENENIKISLITLKNKIENLENENNKWSNLVNVQNSQLDDFKDKNKILNKNIKELKSEIEFEKNSKWFTTKLQTENKNFDEDDMDFDFDFNLDEDNHDINIIENTTIKGIGKKLFNNLNKTNSIKSSNLIDESIKNLSSIKLSKKDSFYCKNSDKYKNNTIISKLEQKSYTEKKDINKVDNISLRFEKKEFKINNMTFKKKNLSSLQKLDDSDNLSYYNNYLKFPFNIKIEKNSVENGIINFDLIIKNLDEKKKIKDFKIDQIKSNSFKLNLNNLNIKEINKNEEIKINGNLNFIKFPLKPINIYFSYNLENESIYDSFEFFFPINEFLIFEKNKLNHIPKFTLKTEFVINRKKINNNENLLTLLKNIIFEKNNLTEIYNGIFKFNNYFYSLIIEIENDNGKLELGFNDSDNLNYKDIHDNILDILK